jgi:hypothetical protein
VGIIDSIKDLQKGNLGRQGEVECSGGEGGWRRWYEGVEILWVRVGWGLRGGEG